MPWHKIPGGFIPSFPQSLNLQLKTEMFLIFVNVNITLNKNSLFSPCTTGCCQQIELMLVSTTAQNPTAQDFALLFHSS